MTVFVVDTDEEGRSALVDVDEPAPVANAGASILSFWTCIALPPRVRPPVPSDDVELITVTLETGDGELTTGDAVRIAGAAHGWRVGDAGCTLLVMTLGATTKG